MALPTYEELTTPPVPSYDELVNGAPASLPTYEELTEVAPQDPEESPLNAQQSLALQTTDIARQVALAPVEANRRATAFTLPREEVFRQIDQQRGALAAAEQREKASYFANPNAPQMPLADAKMKEFRTLKEMEGEAERMTGQPQVGPEYGQQAVVRNLERNNQIPGTIETFFTQTLANLESMTAGAMEAAGVPGAAGLREESTGAHFAASLNPTIAADIGRGAGDVAAMLIGPKNLPAMAAKGGFQAYNDTLAAGGSPEQAKDAALETAPVLFLYLAGGYGAARGAGALVPKSFTPATKGLAQFGAAAAANVEIGSVIRAANDEPTTMRNLAADTLFALHAGKKGYEAASAEARAAAGEILQQERGFSAEQLQEALAAPETSEAVPAIRVVPREESAPASAPESVGERNLGPGAANIEESFGPQFTTSNKESTVNAERAARDLDPVIKEARISNAESIDRARDVLETNPNKGDQIVERLRTNPQERTISLEDSAVMLVEKTNLVAQRDAAAARMLDPNRTPEDVAENAAEFQFFEQKILALDQAAQDARSTWGRFGQLWGRTMRQDYSLVPMEARARLAKGEPLTPEESATIKAQSERIADLERQLAERQTAVTDSDAGKAVDETIKTTKKTAPKGVAGTPEEQTALATKLAERVKAGEPLSDLRSYIQKLVESLVRSGVNERGELVDKVHAIVEPLSPGMTKRQTMDLISGYGDFKPLNKEPVKVRVRELKGELQKVAQIEDVEAKRPLQKSGPERRTASDEERRLTTLLNEAKKKYGVTVTDPATQLKSATDAVVTRLRNQIKDITHRIDTGEKPAGKTPVPEAPEIARLRALRDRVQATLDEIEGPRQISDAQRAKVATASLERQIGDLDRQIKSGRADERVKGPRFTTPEIEALRAQRDAMKAEVDELRTTDALLAEEAKFDAAMKAADALEARLATGDLSPRSTRASGPDTELLAQAKERLVALRDQMAKARAASPEATRAKLDAAQKSVEKSMVELDRRIQAEDFSAKAKKGSATSPELEALRAERDAMKKLFNEMKSASLPKLTREQVAIKAMKTRLTRENAELLDRLARQDFTPKVKRPPVDFSKDAEAVKLRAEADRIKRDFESQKFKWEQSKRSGIRKVFDGVKETLGATRSAITSLDVSAPFRQGGFLLIGDLVTNPARAGRQIGSMIKQLFSEKAFQQAQASLELRPNADLYKDAKLYFADMDGKLSAREESMRSNLVEKIPVIGRLYRGSNRAYTGFLNRQRADAFDSFVEMMGGKSQVTPEAAKLIADAINTMTGRGSAGGMDQAANFLARYLFSPRFLASRFQLALGQPIYSMAGSSPAVRLAIAKQYGKFALGLTAIYGLALLSGGKVEKDPRSADFGKIRIGDSRIDPLAGLAQITTFLARMGTGQTKQGSQVKDKKRSDTFVRFARTKLAPIPGVVADYMAERTLDNKKPTVGGSAIKLAVPIAYQDVPSLYRAHGAVNASVLQMLNLLGMGLQHYGN